MKKMFTFPNIQAVLLLLLHVAETVVMILYKPLPVGIILLIQLIAILFIAELRFAYSLAFCCNRWHSYWRRKNTSEQNDEPSDFLVGITKAIAYFFLFFLQVIFIFVD